MADTSVPIDPHNGSDHDLATDQKSSQRVARRVAVTAEDAPYDISYHPGRVLLYAPVRQRQKWGETQVLPRVNWGDLFFDLFYVAATYNVSYILVDQPSKEGLLYAAGTFLPIMGLWIEKMYYDARFVNEDDIYHRSYQIAQLVILATAVLHIRPVYIMQDSSKYISMFVFTLCLVLDKLFIFVRYIEIYFYGVGQTTVLKMVAKRDIRNHCLSTAFYIAAMIVAAIEYYQSDDSYRRLAEKETTPSTYETASEGTNVPIFLCLFGYVGAQLLLSLNVVFCFPSGGRHKESTVPMNIGFTIHRNGEWTMLMLGESIFSLLIVDVPNEDNDFFTTFYCGILTVILLQYLHFRSQPHDPDGHAMRRSKNAGMGYSLLNHVYSFALVTLGAAFTFFLTAFADEDEDRRLASASASGLDPESRQERGAHLFSGSLAIIFFCLDSINCLHLGMDESRGRCMCKTSKRKNVKGIILVVVRLGVLAFTATLSQWQTEPETLAVIGVICVLVQLLLRKLGAKYLTHSQVHTLEGKQHEQAEAQWPNVTHAQAEPQEA